MKRVYTKFLTLPNAVTAHLVRMVRKFQNPVKGGLVEQHQLVIAFSCKFKRHYINNCTGVIGKNSHFVFSSPQIDLPA